MYTDSDISGLLERLYTEKQPPQNLIEYFLESSGEVCRKLFSFADGIREKHVGSEILLRGIVEISNYCRCSCRYCGLNSRSGAARYRLNEKEIIDAVNFLVLKGLKTVVLQSGEDIGRTPEELAQIIKEIKSRHNDIALTLSLGQHSEESYSLWRRAGADRYFMRIETSDKELYEKMHPGMTLETRLKCLEVLKKLGYSVGCGCITGLPGQTISTLAADLLLFRRYNFEMLGIGPFIPNPKTELSSERPGTGELNLKMVALARIGNPNAHIPATTALGSLEKDYRFDALMCGANVIMPNFTPEYGREAYELYPGRRTADPASNDYDFYISSIASLENRFIAYSRGDCTA